MKILGFGAHPDDIEIFMYGLLNSFLSRGDQVFLAIATDGKAGNFKGDKNKRNLESIRSKETKNGLKSLGDPIMLNLPDGNLSNHSLSYQKIYDVCQMTNPDLVITHDPKDYHPDHRGLSKFVTDAVSFKSPLLYSDTLLGINFEPEYYIDITSNFKKKEKAILAHTSQSPQKFLNVAKIMNSYRASQCNARIGSYAEAYRLNKVYPYSHIGYLLPDQMKIRPYYKNIKDALV